MVHVTIKPELCYRCKTFKRLCGLPNCPVKERLKVIVKTYVKISSSSSFLGGSPPSGVVGEHNYPKVSIYVGVSPESSDDDIRFLEDPQKWWSLRLSLDDVVKLRSSLVSIVQKNINVKSVDELASKEISLIEVSSRPVDCDVNVEKILDSRILFDLKLLPLSVRVLGRLKVCSNPKIDKSVEKIIHDYDMKARDAVIKLYEDGVDIYTIQRAFSFGLLGTRRFRKIVPTRWAITAVDRIITGYLRNKVKQLKIYDKYEIYQITFMNNRFTVIVLPGNIRILWLEFWYPRNGFNNRNPVLSLKIEEDLKGDVETMDGGFEAARMGILEALYRQGFQCRVIIVREILPEYYIGIGNWHIREDTRNVFNLQPLISTYNSNELLKYIGIVLDKSLSDVVSREINKLLSQRSIIETIW